AFAERVGCRSFVVPSALEGVAAIGTQERLRLLASRLRAAGGPVALRLVRLPDGAVEACTAEGPVGRLRGKHAAWVAPLLAHGLSCYALRVTGGSPGKPLRGLNV